MLDVRRLYEEDEMSYWIHIWALENSKLKLQNAQKSIIPSEMPPQWGVQNITNHNISQHSSPAGELLDETLPFTSFSFNCHFQINDDLQVFAVFCKAKQSTEVQSMKSLPAKEADPARASRAPIRVPIPARVFQTTERDPTKSSRCLAEVGSIQCEYLTVHCPFLAMCFQRVSTNSLNEQVLNKVSSTLLRLEFPRPRDSCAETSCGKYCTCFFV